MPSYDQSPKQPASPSRSQKRNAIKGVVNLCLEKGEKPSTAADMYGVQPSTVRTALSRRRKPKSTKQRGGYNKVLREDQELALFRYIADGAENGLDATKGMIFAAICYLLQKEQKRVPSTRWFQKWMNKHEGHLHAIKSNPIAVTCSEPHSEETVQELFTELRKVMEERGITKAT